MSELNEMLLKQIAKTISNQCENITYRFDDGNSNIKHRLPTQIEVMRKELSLLREFYSEYPDDITRNTYYTLKGLIKKHQTPNVLGFLRKIRTKEDRRVTLADVFDKTILEYQSKPIDYIERTITFTQPVIRESIEIAVKKED